MTTPSYPVDLSAEAARAACDAYALLSVPDPHRTDPGYRLTDPATHLEAHVVRAALPYVLRDELVGMLAESFPSDDVDWHYALEHLHELVTRRLADVRRYLETATPPAEEATT